MKLEADLGNFMRENKHYSLKEITKVILVPSLAKLTYEFNRYDDFIVENFEIEDPKNRNKTLYYFNVSTNNYPKYFKFSICIYFEGKRLIIEDKSVDLTTGLNKLLSINKTSDIRIEEFIKNNNDSLEIDELFEIDYFAAIITVKFKNYYRNLCKLNSTKSIEVVLG